MNLQLFIFAATMIIGTHSMCPRNLNEVTEEFNDICKTRDCKKLNELWSCRSWKSRACSSYITQESVTVTVTRTQTLIPTPLVITITSFATHTFIPPAITITNTASVTRTITLSPTTKVIRIIHTVTNTYTKSYAPPIITISPSCPVHPTPIISECSTVPFPPPFSLPAGNANTSATTATATGSASTGLAVLGSFTVLLVLLLVVTITGWVYTATRGRKHKSTILSNKNSGHVIGIHNPVYGAGTLAGSDNQSVVQCNTQTPEYETVAIDNTNGYDVIDRSVPRPPPVSHTHNNESTDQDYSVLDSEDIEHDYHVLEDTAGGGPPSGGGVQDYEVPITRRK